MSAAATHEVLRVIQACRSIELAMAGLYDTLAEIHHHDHSLARLWRKTAREEANHAAQFSLLLEAMPDAVLHTTVDTPALDRLRQAIENTMEEYRLRAPSGRDALVAAIDFEEAMGLVHTDQALVFAERNSQRLFRAMMAADNGHISQLRAALSGLDLPGETPRRPLPSRAGSQPDKPADSPRRGITPSSSRARRGPRRPG